MKNKFLLLFLLANLGLGAQNSDSTAALIPKITLKTKLNGFINPVKPTIEIGADIRIAKRFALDLDLGMYVGSLAYINYDGEFYRGATSRVALKWFFKNRFENLHFLGLQSKQHYAQHRDFQELARFGGQYTESLYVDRTIKIWGPALVFGRRFYFKNPRFFFEAYTGIGVTSYRVSSNTPKDAVLFNGNTGGFTQLPDGVTWFPNIPLGYHIGYTFQ